MDRNFLLRIGKGILGKRRWAMIWLFCLAVMLSGCGVSGGGDQITKMDEKYLTGQDSTSSPKNQEGNSRKKEKDAPAGKGDSECKSSPSSQATPSKSTKSPANSSPKKSKDKLEKSSREKSSSKNLQTDQNRSDASRKEDSRDSGKREEEDSRDSGKGEEEDKDSGGINCFISIDCKNILSHLSKLKESKKEFVPEDGVILNKMKVTLKPGTSVYDVLYQVCRDRNIHLEAAYTPMYRTYYVEGIHQLYEFDCGDLSGWNYTVNGVQPSKGCSKYLVKEGDVIAWRYSCDGGRDL